MSFRIYPSNADKNKTTNKSITLGSVVKTLTTSTPTFTPPKLIVPKPPPPKPTRSVMLTPDKVLESTEKVVAVIPFNGENSILKLVNVALQVEKDYTVSLSLVDTDDESVLMSVITTPRVKTGTVFQEITNFSKLVSGKTVLNLIAKIVPNKKQVEKPVEKKKKKKGHGFDQEHKDVEEIEEYGEATVLTVEFMIQEK